jgi:exodeoxyribonuclease-3
MNELMDTGLIDLFRVQNPNDQSFTWWDYRGGAFHRKQGLRIDLILGTETILKRMHNHVIDRDYRKKQGELTASDHAPVFIDID